MLSRNMDECNAIAPLAAGHGLARTDFEAAARIVDSDPRKKGRLNGPIIRLPASGDWDAFAAMASHLLLAPDRCRAIAHLALVTDAGASGAARRSAPRFVAANIKTCAAAIPARARSDARRCLHPA